MAAKTLVGTQPQEEGCLFPSMKPQGSFKCRFRCWSFQGWMEKGIRSTSIILRRAQGLMLRGWGTAGISVRAPSPAV